MEPLVVAILEVVMVLAGEALVKGAVMKAQVMVVKNNYWLKKNVMLVRKPLKRFFLPKVTHTLITTFH